MKITEKKEKRKRILKNKIANQYSRENPRRYERHLVRKRRFLETIHLSLCTEAICPNTLTAKDTFKIDYINAHEINMPKKIPAVMNGIAG